MLWKCCTQYASKFGKLSSGHRTGKGQFSFQSQRKAMPKNAQTTTKLHSSHTLVKFVCLKEIKNLCTEKHLEKYVLLTKGYIWWKGKEFKGIYLHLFIHITPFVQFWMLYRDSKWVGGTDCSTPGFPVHQLLELFKLMSSWWCHPTISSSVIPFSSCLQSFPESGSF